MSSATADDHPVDRAGVESPWSLWSPLRFLNGPKKGPKSGPKKAPKKSIQNVEVYILFRTPLFYLFTVLLCFCK